MTPVGLPWACWQWNTRRCRSVGSSGGGGSWFSLAPPPSLSSSPLRLLRGNSGISQTFFTVDPTHHWLVSNNLSKQQTNSSHWFKKLKKSKHYITGSWWCWAEKFYQQVVLLTLKTAEAHLQGLMFGISEKQIKQLKFVSNFFLKRTEFQWDFKETLKAGHFNRPP